MSDANKSIARRSWEVFSSGDGALDRALELYAPDVVYHSTEGDLSGRDALKGYLSVYFTAFSNIRITADDVIAEGDKVVSRATANVAHTGDLMGIPPTGKNISVQGITIMGIADGKIAEEWEIFDITGMMQQLGAVPS